MPTDIRHLDRTLPTPAQNLACDEALLNDREANGGPGILRFWESAVCFVVVGYANKVAEEVNLDACARQNVPILRRCTGGGTVVQGPGCLNYSILLPIRDLEGVTRTITDTNRFVMERNRKAMEGLIGKRVDVAGHTDLVIEDRKFSGNAQRRRREWFLFHGTFLYDFDLSLLEQWLRLPTRQPEYRQERSHGDFVTQLTVRAAQIRNALREVWDAKAPFDDVALPSIDAEIQRLTAERYSREEWNRKW